MSTELVDTQPVSFDLQRVAGSENRRLFPARLMCYALLCGVALLTFLNFDLHLNGILNASRLGFDDRLHLFGVQGVLLSVDGIAICFCLNIRPYPIRLELDSRGLRLIYANRRRHVYLWGKLGSGFYLHDVRSRTEFTKPGAVNFECSIATRTGNPVAPLTSEAFDACLGYAERMAGSILEVERKDWWAFIGYITLAGEKIYHVSDPR